jgi:hypothetical protein
MMPCGDQAGALPSVIGLGEAQNLLGNDWCIYHMLAEIIPPHCNDTIGVLIVRT